MRTVNSVVEKDWPNDSMAGNGTRTLDLLHTLPSLVQY